ncbi:rolling circle replication-associated protein [Filifactor alocis]|uniref:rolling circle replication-associated protein n=1 Tax=Filifactor alocis TaxID=143361 RepID=UPI003F9F0B62
MYKNIIREKKIYCGKNYMEVDIYNFSLQNARASRGRSKKEKVSLPSQKNQNEKNAKRSFIQAAETNFHTGDIYLTLTYAKEMLPKTVDEGTKIVSNYIKRIRRKLKKQNMKNLKYMIVTEYRTAKEQGATGGLEEEDREEKPIRMHHHLLISCELSRDELEDMWRSRRKKGEKKGKKIGRANARIIQEDDSTGIYALASYLAKSPAGKRRWTCSQNLERPVQRTNDYKYSRKKIMTIIRDGIDLSFWEKQYPGWTIKDKDNGYQQSYNDFTGWSIYLKLRKKE